MSACLQADSVSNANAEAENGDAIVRAHTYQRELALIAISLEIFTC
jgi:hypothetical protein